MAPSCGMDDSGIDPFISPFALFKALPKLAFGGVDGGMKGGCSGEAEMAKSNLVLALAKVIIAAAWADGQISHVEINSLKDLLYRIPGLNARNWASLEIYIDSPVGPEERERLLEELKAAMTSSADKALVITSLEALAQADGEVSQEEQAVIEEIKASIQSASVGILGGIGRLIRGPIHRRSERVANAPNREADLEDFVKNRVYYGVRRRLGKTDLDISEGELRKLSLAGGLMARVAQVDRHVTEKEFDAVVNALQEYWPLSPEAAVIVAEVANSAIAANMDYYRLAREFFNCTTETERAQFMDILFAVADADSLVTNEETEHIRSIAKNLKLTHRQFIRAKLKIPRERRTS